MIVATVGTSSIPFDRLLLALDELGAGEPLFVQHGPSGVRPAGATCVDYLTHEELTGHMRIARAVVAHGGVGSILTSLACGRRPIVMPRERGRGEAVDEHQLVLARRLARAGVVRLVDTPADLSAALAEPDGETVRASASAGGLASDLGAYLRESLGPAAGSRT